MSKPIYTLGQSPRWIEAFIGLLQRTGVDLPADIRTFPTSRRNPQDWQDALEARPAVADRPGASK